MFKNGVILFFFLCSHVYADENHLTSALGDASVFNAIQDSHDLFDASMAYPEHSLDFPVELTADNDPVGRLMHQYQDHSQPAYYHAGIDLRTTEGQAIRAPVSGRVEAGYYAYTDYPDGRSVKQFLPLAQVVMEGTVPPWGDYYFEVAVIDVWGNRFEFHHVNPQTLPPLVYEKILNRGFVAVGDVVGFVIATSSKPLGVVYHHVHYNIVSPSGSYLNPLYFSKKIFDDIPPEISGVYSVRSSSCGQYWPFLDRLTENASHSVGSDLVVEAFDKIREGTFVFPPTIIRAQFVGVVSEFEWNFTRSLVTGSGELPHLQHLYVEQYCDTFGESGISTTLRKATGNYKFFIKIPVPKSYQGPLTITVEDQYGNSAERSFVISTPIQ